MENIFAAFADKANLIWGAVLTGLSYAFGAHWPLFAFFFVLNVVDYVYGVLKARATNTMSSAKGAKGIIKKVSYWVLIALAAGLILTCGFRAFPIVILVYLLMSLCWKDRTVSASR